MSCIVEFEDMINADNLLSTKTPIDYLLEERDEKVANLHQLSSFFQDKDMLEAMSCFNRYDQFQYGGSYQIPRLGSANIENAIKVVDADFWRKALSLTDVLEFMPRNRREDWFDCLTKYEAPPFTEESVMPTIRKLVAQKGDFILEMVDGIFTGLSKEHLTNRPEGFSKRMIIDSVFHPSFLGVELGFKAGFIHDLRFIIAKFMGEEAPLIHDTNEVLKKLYQTTGKWFHLDGGALRIKVFLKGTAHLEIHPEIAYRLNQLLAMLHPMAIPEPHRRRPNEKVINRAVKLKNNLVSPYVTAFLASRYMRFNTDGSVLKIDRYRSVDKHVWQETVSCMDAIGGTYNVEKSCFEFDYDAQDIVNGIIFNRVLPDKKAHQFYPTPTMIAEDMVKALDIQDTDSILEPSAGQGAIASLLPSNQTTCIEVSQVYCKILKNKGLDTVVCADFLEWNERMFDKIVMNPPYSESRAMLHVQHAATLLNKGGKIIALIPDSFRGKIVVEGMNHNYLHSFDAAFKGTSIKTTMLELTFS